MRILPFLAFFFFFPIAETFLHATDSDLPPDMAGEQAPTFSETQEQKSARLAWWKEAHFGMFIHWGLYAQWGCHYQGKDGRGEHMMAHLKIPVAEYAKIADVFNPVKFDANEWATIAKNAGMKYMILTGKHHDGFAMFNSPSNDYNIVARTPFKRDPVKELAAACHAQGLKFGVYYSLGRDWSNPDWPGRNTWDFPDHSKEDFGKYFREKVKPQIKELLTQYGPIDIIWFDTPEKINKEQSTELRAYIHSLQPDCIVNDRIGNGQGDYNTREQGPQIFSGRSSASPWEGCMTINDNWGYEEGDENFKTPETIIRDLVDVVSNGGSLLLNVGPTGEGIIPAPEVTVLGKTGDWLKVNGQAIYGASRSPLGDWHRAPSPTEKDKKGQPIIGPTWDWRCTTQPGKLFITIFQWPTDVFKLNGVKDKVTAAYLLADPKHTPLHFTQDGTTVSITLPPQAPDPIASVVCLETGP